MNKNKAFMKWLSFIVILLLTITACSSNKLSNNQTVSEDASENPVKEVMVKHNTVTEVFDFGAATTKVILEFENEIDASSLDTSLFSVESVRTYWDSSNPVGTDYEDRDHVEPRRVTKIYLSDDKGIQKDASKYVTIEMAIIDEVIDTRKKASKPYQMNKETHLYDMVDFYYIVKLIDGKYIKQVDGQKITFLPTDKTSYNGDLFLESDMFVHDQKHDFENIQLTYAYYEPSVASEGEKAPLFIWLHDKETGGTDTRVPFSLCSISYLTTEENQEVFGPAGVYVLIPQTPTYWIDHDGSNLYYLATEQLFNSDGDSYYTKALMDLIDTFASEHEKIDRQRIYIAGDLLGGYMTVNMLAEYPDYFAAGIPIGTPYLNEWIDEEVVSALKQTPIWFIHGLDSTFHLTVGSSFKDEHTQALYDDLKEAQAEHVFWTLPEVILDRSGRLMTEDMQAYEYSGIHERILLFNNERLEDIDGMTMPILEWLSKQRLE